MNCGRCKKQVDEKQVYFLADYKTLVCWKCFKKEPELICATCGELTVSFVNLRHLECKKCDAKRSLNSRERLAA